MRRIVYFLFILCLPLPAGYEAIAVNHCGAYNNLKKTKNSGNVHLEIGKHYKVYKKHKGHYLIAVKGANPKQRWVKDSCLSTNFVHTVSTSAKRTIAPISLDVVQKKNATKSKKAILALTWHNAFCEMMEHKKECKRTLLHTLLKSSKGFVLHGLWPQPKSNIYCNVPRSLIALDKRGAWHRLPEPKLDKDTYKELKEVMPGVASNLHRHEWIKHGTCSGLSANDYFKVSIALTKAISNSEVATLFKHHEGKRITLKSVAFAMDQSFGKGSGKAVAMRCKRGLVMELWIHLDELSEEIEEAIDKKYRRRKNTCKSGIVDRAGQQWR